MFVVQLNIASLSDTDVTLYVIISACSVFVVKVKSRDFAVSETVVLLLTW